MISNSVICGVSSWLSSLIHSKHFFFILKLYSPAFSLGVAISLALFCPLKFPLLPISYKQSHLKILHLYRVKEDVSHYSWIFYLHLCLYFCFFFILTLEDGCKFDNYPLIQQVVFVVQKMAQWELVSTVNLSVQMNNSVLTSRVAATSSFIISSGWTNVQSIANVKL